MHSKVLRRLLLVGYGGLLTVAFVLSSYFAFSLFVRRGEVTVPDLRGLSLEDSRARLESLGISLRWNEERDGFAADVPPGGLIGQRPKAGSHLKRGGLVNVSLSLGRELIEVPDLRGLNLQTAQLALRSASLDMGSLGLVYEAGEVNNIVRQSPIAGTKVDPETAVDVFVALEGSGGSFVMPDLVYRRYDSVRGFFESRGFRFGSIKYEPYEGIAPGIVLRQFPLAGHRLAQSDVISLVVAAAVSSSAGG